MKDLTTRSDIEQLVNNFYDKVRSDSLLGPVFNEIAAINWIEHLPKMYQFWETLLLDKVGYKGSPVAQHVHLSRMTPMTKGHFNKWLKLWNETIDESFKGELADRAKQRADYLAMLMQYKIKAA